MAGKKRKLDDLGDDLDLFTYGNQIPLTFSVPTKTAAVVDDSDSSDDNESDNDNAWDRNENDDAAVDLDVDSDEEVAYINDEADDGIDLDESQGSRRSPSPPPPVPQAALLKLQMQMQKKKSAREFDQTFDALKQAFNAQESPVVLRTANRSSASVVCLTDPYSPVSDSERNITIKVRTSTGIKKFDMKAREKFERIFKELSEGEGVPEGNLLLSLKDTNIQQENTPLQVGATVADIIECVVMKSQTRNPDDDEDAIEIKVHGGTAATSKNFKVLKDQPLQSLIDKYCKFRKLSRSKLAFSFDGDVIKGAETAEGLDLEDGDIIDVRTL